MLIYPWIRFRDRRFEEIIHAHSYTRAARAENKGSVTAEYNDIYVRVTDILRHFASH